MEYSFIWCLNLDESGIRSETTGKFLNAVLEKDGKDHGTDHVRNEEVSLRVRCDLKLLTGAT
jgi:hypothetical protein